MVGVITKDRIIYILEVLFQQILAVFVLLIFWELFVNPYDVKSQATWHIILAVLGVALCMAEGVQIYRKQSLVTFGETRDDKKKAHLVIMIFAFICITTAIALKIDQKVDVGANHFESVHAKLGLSAWIISFVTLIGGALAYRNRRVSILSPTIIKIIHIVIGVSAYIIGVATIIVKLDHLVIQTRGWVALTVLLVLYATYSLVGPFLSFINHITNT